VPNFSLCTIIADRALDVLDAGAAHEQVEGLAASATSNCRNYRPPNNDIPA
jgi:hypothetical protein